MKAEEIVGQIDKLVSHYEALKRRSQYDDLSDLGEESKVIVVRLHAAIDRLVPRGTTYANEMASIENDPVHVRIPIYVGILRALRDDMNDGWLETIAELLHADTFADFLDQASELLDKGYKDAAAVVAGSTCESHIRLLCTKCSVDLKLPSGAPKKADVLNAELVKAGAYNTVQQKAITAWLAIRNASAHAQYDAYGKAQVADVINSVRDFIKRHPV